MIRKILSLVIITCMILHCASRLGTLSYLYEKRNTIAFTLGLISEIPIATCSSSYQFNDGLTIIKTLHDVANERSFPTAIEITLFFSGTSIVIPAHYHIHYKENKLTSLSAKPLSGCLRSVFHPPVQLS